MPGNLPHPVSGFVGRADARRRVGAALDRSRLVTLSGPGGFGKSRLALEVAHHRSPAGGTWLVGLARVTDPAMITTVVGQAVGARERAWSSGVDALVAALDGDAALLVLDDCEHLVTGCGPVVTELLERCPSLRVLTTSRRVLGVDDEAVVRLGPLETVEGRELFAARTRLTGIEADDDPSTVDAICRRLDGMPLAIELAAALRRTFAPSEILARLDEPLDLLAATGTSTRSRHATLAAAIGWSDRLLSPATQHAFRRFGAFAGPFTADHAGEVAGLSPGEVDVALAELTASSLLVADTAVAPTRYRMLDTVRDHAIRELTTSGLLDTARAAHCRSYLALAERAEPALTGPGQVACLDRLQDEQAEMRAALGWATAGGDPDAALRLAAALKFFWHLRGSMTEGVTWSRAALDVGPAIPSGARAAALWGFGVLASFTGDVAAALPALQESVRVAREVGDDRVAGRALSWLGQLSWFGGDLTGARRLLTEAVTLARAAEDRWCLADTSGALAFVEVVLGEVASANRAIDECTTVARAAGDLQGEAFGLIVRSHLALCQGRLDDAEADARELLRLLDTLGGDYSASQGRAVLAGVARRRGEPAVARTHARRALDLASAAGIPSMRVYAMLQSAALADPDGRIEELEAAVDLASAHSPLQLPQAMAEHCAAVADRGDDGVAALAARAREQAVRVGDRWAECLATRVAADVAEDPRAGAALVQSALRTAIGIGDRVAVAECREAVAARIHPDHPVVAVRLLAAAGALRERSGWREPSVRRRRAEALRDELRSVLGAPAFDDAWRQGCDMTDDQADRLAEGTRGPRRRPASGWAGLTPSERQVARLAADGLTNPQIAGRLFVSPRTVQTHLAHVFTKLAVSRRTELVVIVQRHAG